MELRLLELISSLLDLAEDRGSFSTSLLKDNDIPYPMFDTASTADEALAVAEKLDFPILVRPSYVLGRSRNENCYK